MKAHELAPGVRHITLVTILAVFSVPILAFIPKGEGHAAITREALSGITRTVEGTTIRFSERAIGQVIVANEDTDCGGSGKCLCYECQKDSSRHFDSESFRESTGRLLVLRSEIINALTQPSPNGSLARQKLGEALHAIQDFYSHSNWIVLRNVIDTRLGRTAYGQGNPDPPPTADSAVHTCPNDPTQLEGNGHTFLTTGYFKVPDLCVDDLGNLPAGKCIHGNFDVVIPPLISEVCPDGISKDKLGRPGFQQARDRAVEASIDFVNLILNDSQVATNARAIRALMDVRSTFAVVMDETHIPAGLSLLKAQIANVVNSVAGTPDEPARYVLVSYSDADVGPAFATANASDFLAALDAIEPRVENVCPKRSFAALERALVASQTDASVFLFARGDTPSDLRALQRVISSADTKRIRISPLIYGGACDPGTPLSAWAA